MSRSFAVACALVLWLGSASCKNGESESTQGSHPVAAIVDLSTSTADLARDFDAHAGEPRFVMVLSPT